MKRLVVSLVSFSVMACTGFAATAIPYKDTCENAGNSFATPWSVSSGTATYVATNGSPVTGSTAIGSITDGATLDIDETADTYANVWFYCYTKVTAQSSEPSALDTEHAGFYLTSANVLRAWNEGSGWVDVQSGVNASAWNGIAVHLDYVSDTYDLYWVAVTETYGTKLSKINSSPLAMHGTPTELSEIEISGTTLIDDLAVSEGSTTNGTKSLADVKIRSESSIPTGRWIASVVPNHSYTAGTPSANLLGQLGLELAAGMDTSDKIRFYENGAEQQYTLSGGAWGKSLGDTNPVDKEPKPGEMIWRWYAADPAQYTFYSETANPDVAEAAVFDQPDTLDSVTVVENGWTARRWTAAAKEPVSAGLNNTVCPDGSYLYTIPRGSYQFTRRQMVSGAWVPAVNLQPGDQIWIDRGSDGQGSQTWDMVE